MATKPPRKTTDGEYTLCCPGDDCDSTRIRPRSTKGDWYCSECGLRFDKPEHRERKGIPPGHSLSGPSRILWDADPSEYP